MSSVRFKGRYGRIIKGDQTPGGLYMRDGELVYFSLVPKDENARREIEKLLTNETCHGKYSTGSEITSCPIPQVEILIQDENGDKTVRKKELSFPLDAEGVEAVKSNAERAGVGLLDKTIVNLDVRKT